MPFHDTNSPEDFHGNDSSCYHCFSALHCTKPGKKPSKNGSNFDKKKLTNLLSNQQLNDHVT